MPDEEWVGSSMEVVSCEDADFQNAIITLTEESDFDTGKILKIYEFQEYSRTSKELRCKGTARTSKGVNDLIEFEYYIIEDDEGDRFYGVSYQ